MSEVCGNIIEHHIKTTEIFKDCKLMAKVSKSMQ